MRPRAAAFRSKESGWEANHRGQRPGHAGRSAPPLAGLRSAPNGGHGSLAVLGGHEELRSPRSRPGQEQGNPLAQPPPGPGPGPGRRVPVGGRRSGKLTCKARPSSRAKEQGPRLPAAASKSLIINKSAPGTLFFPPRSLRQAGSRVKRKIYSERRASEGATPLQALAHPREVWASFVYLKWSLSLSLPPDSGGLSGCTLSSFEVLQPFSPLSISNKRRKLIAS